jgi:hypothetical protein
VVHELYTTTGEVSPCSGASGSRFHDQLTVNLSLYFLRPTRRASIRARQLQAHFHPRPLHYRTMADSMPKTMKGILIEKTGGVEVLQYKTDLPVPSPKEGEILVKNEYIGVNYIDTYSPPPKSPFATRRNFPSHRSSSGAISANVLSTATTAPVSTSPPSQRSSAARQKARSSPSAPTQSQFRPTSLRATGSYTMAPGRTPNTPVPRPKGASGYHPRCRRPTPWQPSCRA